MSTYKHFKVFDKKYDWKWLICLDNQTMLIERKYNVASSHEKFGKSEKVTTPIIGRRVQKKDVVDRKRDATRDAAFLFDFSLFHARSTGIE